MKALSYTLAMSTLILHACAAVGIGEQGDQDYQNQSSENNTGDNETIALLKYPVDSAIPTRFWQKVPEIGVVAETGHELGSPHERAIDLGRVQGVEVVSVCTGTVLSAGTSDYWINATDPQDVSPQTPLSSLLSKNYTTIACDRIELEDPTSLSKGFDIVVNIVHIDELLVQSGDSVRAGQVIGTMTEQPYIGQHVHLDAFSGTPTDIDVFLQVLKTPERAGELMSTSITAVHITHPNFSDDEIVDAMHRLLELQGLAPELEKESATSTGTSDLGTQGPLADIGDCSNFTVTDIDAVQGEVTVVVEHDDPLGCIELDLEGAGTPTATFNNDNSSFVSSRYFWTYTLSSLETGLMTLRFNYEAKGTGICSIFPTNGKNTYECATSVPKDLFGNP
ncbi:MAG: hypothetical protein IPJ88_09815 [Myxococcales bacterium]|nr:MAG: hypothetical protein IPJ88_09815 [Myxococcales bacterium]